MTIGRGMKLRQLAKSFGSNILGFGILAAVVALPFLFFTGAAWLGNKILPYLSVLSLLAMAVTVVILLPLSAVRRLQEFIGNALILASYLHGATCWFYSLLLTLEAFGIIGVLSGLLLVGVGVLPLALLGAAWNQWWDHFGSLLLLASLTYTSRKYGLYLGRIFRQRELDRLYRTHTESARFDAGP